VAHGDLVKETKSDLRAALRQARRTASPTLIATETSATIAVLRTLLTDRGHPPLASYMAVHSELDLADLHRGEWASGRPVWLPRVIGQSLVWHPVRAATQLQPGSFAIPEPDPAQVPDEPLPRTAVLVVPGLGFAADGFRLGQGAGFYDRTLPSVAGLTIGVGFSCQRHDDVPRERHDHPVRAVLLGGTWILPPSR